MIPIIDLFAGPGGLNEGFSQVSDQRGHPVFQTVGSFEMEPTAVSTLRLREVYRSLRLADSLPVSYYQFIRAEISSETFFADKRVNSAYKEAKSRIHRVELGSPGDDSEVLIRSALGGAGVRNDDPWVLIGGPPCQAYSLAGRSRRANDVTFAEDKKHFLYREYLRIIRTFRPAVFVMENVKGLLSSTTAGESMFNLIKNDLERPGADLEYEIFSLTSPLPPPDLSPADFLIKSELYGVPQKRHRVILLGIRRGFLGSNRLVQQLVLSNVVTVTDALRGLPKLRSGISPTTKDSYRSWIDIRNEAATESQGSRPQADSELRRGSPSQVPEGDLLPGAFSDWIIDPDLHAVIQHESRFHMKEDLKRYWFAADFARRTGISPKLAQFPANLQPNHRNAMAASRPFNDRFRVQLADAASSTVVSHIAKDGHYYIHPDPDQMRSLTVREAARLQTFPDNYFFMGTRTQQYHQVGNAVPPLLANQIGRVVAKLFE